MFKHVAKLLPEENIKNAKIQISYNYFISFFLFDRYHKKYGAIVFDKNSETSNTFIVKHYCLVILIWCM